MSGRLLIVGTPIGNLKDATLRAKEALMEAQVIFAEDTRVTIKLLNHLNLKKKLISCYEHNEVQRANMLAELAQQDLVVALVCDAGMPLVSDPGFVMVKQAIELNMQVVPISGPSALLLALVASGLPCNRFAFEGFLPERASERRKRLEKLKLEERTLVFYVATHDQKTIVNDALTYLGDRQACLARELTKLFEEFLRGSLSQLNDLLSQKDLKGELVLVVAGAESREENVADRKEVIQAVDELLMIGGRLKDLSSLVAKKVGWSKSDVYKIGLERQKVLGR